MDVLRRAFKVTTAHIKNEVIKERANIEENTVHKLECKQLG